MKLLYFKNANNSTNQKRINVDKSCVQHEQKRYFDIVLVKQLGHHNGGWKHLNKTEIEGVK